MKISPILEISPISALKDNYIWCIQNGSFAVVVDPGDAGPVIHFLREHKLTLIGIFVTHHHGDHTAGIPELINWTKAQLGVFEHGEQQCSKLKNASCLAVYGSYLSKNTFVTHPLREGDEIYLPELKQTFKIIEIPGHTSDHIAFYNQDVLFSGDTLFSGGCGRVFEGTMTQMYQSLIKLKSLPQRLKLYCGHEYTLANLKFAEVVEPDNKVIQKKIIECRQQAVTLPSTLAIEQQINPFFRCDQVSVKQTAFSVAKSFVKKDFTSLEKLINEESYIFELIRTWKNNF